MTGSGHNFVEWKEEFVSQERGSRVVHYFLKDSAGESILAVKGTSRGARHMFYAVAEEFVQAYGVENGRFKWRSRREVVDWLTSMLPNQHLQLQLQSSPIRVPEESDSIGEENAHREGASDWNIVLARLDAMKEQMDRQHQEQMAHNRKVERILRHLVASKGFTSDSPPKD